MRCVSDGLHARSEATKSHRRERERERSSISWAAATSEGLVTLRFETRERERESQIQSLYEVLDSDSDGLPRGAVEELAKGSDFRLSGGLTVTVRLSGKLSGCDIDGLVYPEIVG